MSFDAQQKIQDARGGNDEVLGQLLESYKPYLILLARVQIGQRLRGKVDPDDMIQEVFLEAHRALRQFRGTTEHELTAWLRSILAGRLTLMIRRYIGAKGRDVRLERELGGAAGSVVAGAGPRAGGVDQHAQPAGLTARAGGAIGGALGGYRRITAR